MSTDKNIRINNLLYIRVILLKNIIFVIVIVKLMEEKELIRKVKNGDSTAFAALYDCYWQKVYNFTKLYIATSNDVTEVVQDVFVKLWEARHLLADDQGLEGFLFIVTRNIIFNMSRKNFRESMFKMTVIRAMESEETYDMEDEFSAADLKLYIDRLIAVLPKRQQEVFKMSREQHMSYKEIASHCGISEKAVERHIYLALKFLKKNLPIFILFMGA